MSGKDSCRGTGDMEVSSQAGGAKDGSALGKVLGWIVGRAENPEVQPGQTVVQDSLRESLDTLVFVIILVLILKTFVAECFVIPTGSMAETLYGYQKIVNCPECSHQFPVNCSDEVEFPELRGPQPFCTCPNCMKDVELMRPGQLTGGIDAARFPDPGPKTGDRVMVSKFHYDLLGKGPSRHDVVVFKYPGNSGEGRDPHYPVSGPQKQHTPFNYIKRLMGRSGEVVAVHGGDLYLMEEGWSPDKAKPDEVAPKPENPLEMWFHKQMLIHFESKARRNAGGGFDVDSGNGLNDPKPGAEALDVDLPHSVYKAKFDIIRKPPGVVLAEARIVYDADKPAKDMQDHPRWRGDIVGEWNPQGTGFSCKIQDGNKTTWLRYHHLIRTNRRRPPAGVNGPDTVRYQLITDVMGYNLGRFTEDPFGFKPTGPDNYRGSGDNWASDLILEGTIATQGKTGEFICELSKGVDRFQARIDGNSGKCVLLRLDGKGQPVELGSADTAFRSDGKKRHFRFANVDRKLIVWLDGALPFGEGVTYQSAIAKGPTANDFQPASFASKGLSVDVASIKLWRDSYYTSRDNPSSPDQDVSDWTVPLDWTPDRPLPDVLRALQWMPVRVLRVPEGHYLCLGDNSANSSDSRSWGTVPRRLLLGRALLIYWPYNRIGLIR